MIHYADGPAEGQTMLLRRAPVFLRVVWGASGKWDALDQIDDTPEDDEDIFVYSRPRGKVGTVHVDFADRSKSAWYALATYRLAVPQPAEWQMRDNAAWQQWCREQTGAAPCSSFCHPEEHCAITTNGDCDAKANP